MDDVETVLLKNCCNPPVGSNGPAQLMTGQKLEWRENPATKGVDCYVRWMFYGSALLTISQHRVGITVMNNVDLMTVGSQSVYQPMHIYPVAAKIVGRVEGRDHAETEFSHPVSITAIGARFLRGPTRIRCIHPQLPQPGKRGCMAPSG